MSKIRLTREGVRRQAISIAIPRIPNPNASAVSFLTSGEKPKAGIMLTIAQPKRKMAEIRLTRRDQKSAASLSRMGGSLVC